MRDDIIAGLDIGSTETRLVVGQKTEEGIKLVKEIRKQRIKRKKALAAYEKDMKSQNKEPWEKAQMRRYLIPILKEIGEEDWIPIMKRNLQTQKTNLKVVKGGKNKK